MADATSSNTLGLDFARISLHETDQEGASTQDASTTNNTPSTNPPVGGETPSTNAGSKDKKDKQKPYVNPDRVNTGGPVRDKLSEEALNERMARMREQNEKIKQRRLDVAADEEAFRHTQQVEKAKQAQSRKVQEDINRAREKNAQRKMDRIQTREWDSGKPNHDRRGGAQRGARSSAGVDKAESPSTKKEGDSENNASNKTDS